MVHKFVILLDFAWDIVRTCKNLFLVGPKFAQKYYAFPIWAEHQGDNTRMSGLILPVITILATSF